MTAIRTRAARWYARHPLRLSPLATAAVAIVALGVAAVGAATMPPDAAPAPVVRIDGGMSAPQAAAELAQAHVVAHPRVLRAILRLAGAGARIQAGAYSFEKPQNAVAVAYRLVAGDFGLPPVRLTFLEGFTTRDAAAEVAAAFPGLSANQFLAAAKPDEGYLFPDTYVFSSSADAATIVATMQKNFDAKIAPLEPDIAASGHSLSEIITLASLVEREARTTTDRKMVAGILWNRLDRGMPLQVDAVFGYIFGRDTYSPSFADLKVDSPYNTYTHTGLPPGPICNPSLSAIEAVLHPTPTKYLYYLTGTDGHMHYATTYQGHQANERTYL
jgi:UPF0755 protein